MAKIVRFKTPQDSVVEAIESLLQRAKDGEIKSFIFAAKMSDEKTIATSWQNVDIGDRNELVAHIQADIMYAVVEANIDKLIEWV